MASIDSYLNPYLKFPVDWRKLRPVLRTERESGDLPIRRLKTSQVLYAGTLEAAFYTKAEADGLRDFYEARKGGAEAFTWTNPEDGVVYSCLFADDELGLRWDEPGRRSCAFGLIGKVSA